MHLRVITAVVLIASSLASAATTQEIQQAVDKAKEYLYAQQLKDRTWEYAFTGHGVQKTGQTALAVYALLCAGESPQDERLAPALEYLRKTPTTGVYALGLRCQIWLMLPPTADVRAAMNRDANILVRGVKRGAGPASGFYDYNSGGGGTSYSHSRAQYGVLGVWAAQQMGLEVPREYWFVVEKAWLEHQDPSGGWNYIWKEDRFPVTPGMTAVGVATLFITQEYLHANDGIPCKGNVRSPNIDRGVKWLADNFAKVGTNERYPRDYPYATIYAVERVGLAGGLKYFGDINWYEKGAGWLVKGQRKDGSWPEEEGMPHFSTSMALLFLSRGSAPVLMNKLDYSASPEKQANWNQRPRDVANVARWTGQQLEREINWQVVNLNAAPVEELHDAPILYIAGNETLKLTAEQEQKVKTFVEQGGIVLGNADCASPAFTNSFKALGQKLFPLYEFAPLPDAHPIYTNQMFDRAKWKRKPVIFSQRNGARELMILLPTADAGRAWQLKETRTKEDLFQFMTNLFLYAVDKQGMLARGESYIVTPAPPDPKAKPSRPIKVARLKYAGNFDPEPGGWRRLAAVMHNGSQAQLAVEVVNPVAGNLNGFDVAHLTGTVEFALTPAELEEIKRYVNAGGTLVIDATGGSGAFATTVERALTEMFAADAKQLENPLPPAHPLYAADGKPLGEVGYRSFARSRLGMINVPQLRGITTNDGRLAVIYSKEDLSVGLVGQPVDGIVGYSPSTATTLMSKLLLYATQKGAARASATAPAAATPATAPSK